MARRRSRARRHAPDGPFEAHIGDLAHDARGIARVDGKVVFITDALPDEDVRYVRTRKKASYDEGHLQAVLNPSPNRVDPQCVHFGVCGGCSLQHLAPEAQIEFKQSQMLDNLRRIGGVEPEEVAPSLKGPLWGYRRRARLAVKNVPVKDRVLVGFRERGNPYVAVLEGCEVLDPSVGKKLLSLADLIAGLSIKDSLPQIEVAVGDNAVALVLRVLKPPADPDLELLKAYSRQEDVWFYLQSGGLDTVRPLLEDTPELFFQLEKHRVSLFFEPVDFIQVNGEINQYMIDQAMDWLEVDADDEILELFCGLGNFSLPLSRVCRQVVGIEGDAGLVKRAAVNATRNGLKNVEFHHADLYAETQNAVWAKNGYTKALIDPPRAGAEEILPVLAETGIRRLLYVSCHPATLARDLGILVSKHGFRLQKAGVIDMFPHTSHVESMALLVRD